MEDKAKVLVVDDDSNIRELIQIYLEEDFNLSFASNGLEAVEKAKEERPALVLLDIMLPHKNGWEVCKDIRSFSKMPIIMVSAKGEEIDKVLGLELGADDYITKPFSPRELLARVKAHIRRNAEFLEDLQNKDSANLVFRKSQKSEEIKLGTVTVNIKNHKAYVENKELELTVKEFELLLFLMSNRGQVFTRVQLLDKVWGFDFVGDSRAVDQAVKRLRKKLTSDGNTKDYIHTIWGLGYKFEVPS